MPNTPDNPYDSPEEADNAASSWLAERLSKLMSEHGIPPRQQAGVLSELCGLSLSQARRKLHGAVWSFEEVLAVVRRYGASLDQLFLAAPGAADAGVDAAASDSSLPLLPAVFLMDSLCVPCQFRLGAQCVATPRSDDLLAANHAEGWFVGTPEQLEKRQAPLPLFHADHILLTPEKSLKPTRIAILDDEAGVCETLSEWFNAVGYEAASFRSAAQLLAAGIEQHDAFVVDFMLGDGDSSQIIVKKIREALPLAPIVLFTGKLRSGQASEADLTTLLRTVNVIFFEKPIRPSVVAASIETQLASIRGASR